MIGRRLAVPTVLAVLSILTVGLLTGCSSGAGPEVSPSSTLEGTAATTSIAVESRPTITAAPEPAPSSSSAAPRPKESPPTTPVGEVSIRGSVGATFASAQVVLLAAPVSGVTEVTVSDQTRILRANRTPGTFADLGTGVAIEVRGQRVSGTGLAAREILLS